MGARGPQSSAALAIAPVADLPGAAKPEPLPECRKVGLGARRTRDHSEEDLARHQI
jgi:hypothetical protein